MRVAILELLPEGSSGFCWSRGLYANDLDELNDATPVVFLVLLTGESVDLDSNSTERFLLWYKSVSHCNSMLNSRH